jgi:hypothetical protein
MRHTASGALVIVMSLSAVLLAAPKFISTWKSPDAAGTTLAGKKVAALVITKDINLQMSGEEALVRELAAIGIANGVAAYRMIPRAELEDAAKAKPWFERANVEAVVTLRLVSAEKEQVYTPTYGARPAIRRSGATTDTGGAPCTRSARCARTPRSSSRT